MSKNIAGMNITATCIDGAYYMSTPRYLPNNHDSILEDVTGWVTYLWPVSSVWIIPNLMRAIVSEVEFALVVPGIDSDESELITVNPVAL